MRWGFFYILCRKLHFRTLAMARVQNEWLPTGLTQLSPSFLPSLVIHMNIENNTSTIYDIFISSKRHHVNPLQAIYVCCSPVKECNTYLQYSMYGYSYPRTYNIACSAPNCLLVTHVPDRAIMMMNCSLLISFLMMCRLLHSVRASGRMKGVTGADWASFCLRRVATSVCRVGWGMVGDRGSGRHGGEGMRRRWGWESRGEVGEGWWSEQWWTIHFVTQYQCMYVCTVHMYVRMYVCSTVITMQP